MLQIPQLTISLNSLNDVIVDIEMFEQVPNIIKRKYNKLKDRFITTLKYCIHVCNRKFNITMHQWFGRLLELSVKV